MDRDFASGLRDADRLTLLGQEGQLLKLVNSDRGPLAGSPTRWRRLAGMDHSISDEGSRTRQPNTCERLTCLFVCQR
jgi:hypothetical protein